MKLFWEKYKDAEQPLKTWYNDTMKASWKNSQDIKMDYSSASIIDNNRVVFNISGNKYRLVVVIKYKLQIIYIRFIGTHKEYDKLNVKEV